MPSTNKKPSLQKLSAALTLFHGSFILDFLQPPKALGATVLMRTTYTGPLQAPGKCHGQSPPLHLHFDQCETFYVQKGSLGSTCGWDAKDEVWTSEMKGLEGGVHRFEAWEPHTFCPRPVSKEDTTIYRWCHPTDVPEPMDAVFFENLLRYLSDVTERKVGMSLMRIMIMQYASATALIMFPTVWWLGPLRWWVPWNLQAALAWVGGCLRHTPIMREYTEEEVWREFVQGEDLEMSE